MAREIKKLSSDSDSWAIIGTINDLIDDVMALNRVITSDIVRIATDEIIEELSEDTHRTVTLRIPKDMRIGEAILTAWQESDTEEEKDTVWTFLDQWLDTTEDTDLQKVLDEVEK